MSKVERSRQECSVSINDALMTAIALPRRSALVSRHQEDFCGIADLKSLSPWGNQKFEPEFLPKFFTAQL
ncbi:stbB [Synechococcus elongatus PCC 6311]|uniref:Uncharacterized protein n=1 Tax=Synechococcus elongatus (strain ATCC 33912 / PCC 7942 / FACHB-805) TaxID=1140 RepID=Q31N02_SYNE7|nr:hypothetical protein Synpcc7942_1537 [Synechococcus elongatus PCC 7942 = FACHB-805]UOW71353.1 stbB [Synechococcus elongatus PCC 7943]UOW74100.1 stbB [Synechococcus elongatus PCC 6311]UOW76821.1 hypothetical protein PCC6301pg_1632 [Synechococcus elongatus PCC 6301]